MSTFFKICPPELYASDNGGNRADSMNYLRLINGSEVFWMHLEDADESTVRGLEVNSVIIDQAEEIGEGVYTALRARVGRWDVAEVPENLLTPAWPRNPETNRPMAPAYMMLLCNPDSELHWIYRYYHPESIEHIEKYSHNHQMIQASSTENPTLDPQTLADMMSNDPVWVRRFVFGVWGIPGGAIHELNEESILELEVDDSFHGTYSKERKAVLVSKNFYETLRRSANLYRVLDHGDASPTCCLWIASWKSWFFVIREYYKPGTLISENRKNIGELSHFESGEPESYVSNWADPSIFKKAQQKFGGFWSVAEEYFDARVEGPPLVFQPADNNEISTRNRLNEYFKRSEETLHPITGKPGAPKFYFFKRNALLPSGAYFAINETKAQKRKQLGSIEGKPVFSDDRDDNVSDHAYDCVRYFAAMHPFWSKTVKITPPKGSFFDARKQLIAMKKNGGREIRLGAY